MKTKRYISQIESYRCRKVANAFKELYDMEGESIVVRDAGRYGFIKAQYYKEVEGFTDIYTFTNSKDLFIDLWHEWVYHILLEKAKGTPMEELEYKEIYQCMSLATKRMIARKKISFLRKAGISIIK